MESKSRTGSVPATSLAHQVGAVHSGSPMVADEQFQAFAGQQQPLNALARTGREDYSAATLQQPLKSSSASGWSLTTKDV